jgi:hypothetical protein
MLLPRARGIFFLLIFRAGCLVGISLLISTNNFGADTVRSNVFCREEISATRRGELESKLRKITGWPDLSFNSNGALHIGSQSSVGGSATARQLIAKAISGLTVTVIEDASKRSDVAFCRVLPGRWKKNNATNPQSYVVLIDFQDFEELVGDEQALASFNVGWGLLHEIDHIVNDSPDAASPGEAGECEAHLNQMRRECDLPERVDYFYRLVPLSTDTAFKTMLVRLAFEQEDPRANKKRRYWVLWDARVVGGPDLQKQIAALR